MLGELPGRPKEVAAIQAFPEHRQPSGAFNKTEGLSRSDARTYIRSLKHKLSEEPRLALSWCDRALAYTILGQDEKAEWCIKIALALAPTHRGVVRVAVRFYAHIEKADHAHWLTVKHPNLRNDPWLQSCEIVCSELCGERPSSMANAVRDLKLDRWTAENVTELASAVGTEELLNGHVRVARRCVERSLVCANENSLAQAYWLLYSKKMYIESLDDEKRQLRYCAEAASYDSARNGRFDDALDYSEKWGGVEPFSIRPVRQAVWLALTVLGDCKRAQTLCDEGLDLQPRDPTLLNNKTVALAISGNLDGAMETLKRIDLDEVVDKGMMAVLCATVGLLHCRCGHYEVGDELYQLAENHFRGAKVMDDYATAMAYHGREALISGHVNQAERLFEHAVGAEKKLGVGGEQRRRELTPFVERARSEGPAAGTVGRQPIEALNQACDRIVSWCRSRISS